MTEDTELEIELKKFHDKDYKAHPEKLAERKTLDSMVRFDKTFKMIMEHVKRMLDCSHFDLNRHIKATIFSDSNEPSPMLKFYNELI